MLPKNFDRQKKGFTREVMQDKASIHHLDFRIFKVPNIWKDATIAPIPNETPATISKLRPISLTAHLAKFARVLFQTVAVLQKSSP